MPSLLVGETVVDENQAYTAINMQISGGLEEDPLIDHVTYEMAKFNCFSSRGSGSFDSMATNSTCSSSEAGYPDNLVNPATYYHQDPNHNVYQHPATMLNFCMPGDLAGIGRATQNTTDCVPVPSSEHVAEIVGRQGCKIKALRAKTNTYIKTPVRGEESVFIVTGRKEDVESAKGEIIAAADHFTQIRASRRHSQGGIPAPGHITAYVRVPYKFVGLVVGPKGATIKRIQQGTHTYIITPSRDKEPIFEVTGLSENVEAARQEIEVHIVSRTGVLLQALDELHGANKNFDTAMLQQNGGNTNMLGVVDDFHLNGIEAAYDQLPNGTTYCCGKFECTCDTMNVVVAQQPLPTPMIQQQPVNVIRKPLGSSFLENHTNVLIRQDIAVGVCKCKHGNNNSSLLPSQAQPQTKYTWTDKNLSGTEQDDGVWSMGGDSPLSFNVHSGINPVNNPIAEQQPFFPAYLSSIWSDFD